MFQRIRVLIADDESLGRARLRQLLERDGEIELAGESCNGEEAVLAIETEWPDLVLLDVQMPELDGFGVLEAVGPEQMPLVVFVTAFDQYAIRAFEVRAVDYLLKPFDTHRFQEAFRRARNSLAHLTKADQTQKLLSLLEDLSAAPGGLARRGEERYLERMMVKVRGRVLFLRVSEIRWIEAEGNYVRVHVGEESYLVRETMSALEQKLDPARFLRVHRSTIVNLDEVRELRPWFAGDYVVALHDGKELRLSRGYRSKLEERLS